MTENADISNDHGPASTTDQAEPSAATVARDQLLSAIGREAMHVTKSQPGHASAALVELARAYAFTRDIGVTVDSHFAHPAWK